MIITGILRVAVRDEGRHTGETFHRENTHDHKQVVILVNGGHVTCPEIVKVKSDRYIVKYQLTR